MFWFQSWSQIFKNFRYRNQQEKNENYWKLEKENFSTLVVDLQVLKQQQQQQNLDFTKNLTSTQAPFVIIILKFLLRLYFDSGVNVEVEPDTNST